MSILKQVVASIKEGDALTTVALNSDDYRPTSIEIVKHLLSKKLGGIYITTTRPSGSIIADLKKIKADLGDLYFVDMISLTVGGETEDPRTLFIESPTMLESVLLNIGFGCAQLSFNVTNFRTTPLHAVFDAACEEAQKRGIRVTGSEIVGLVPWEVLRQAAVYYLHRMGKSPGLPVPDLATAAIQSLGLRDVAMLEILYGAGLRASELVELPIEAIDFRGLLLRVVGKGKKERIVPMGEVAANALDEYMKRGRPLLLADRDVRGHVVFLTRRGKGMTRQNFFLRIRQHAQKAGIDFDWEILSLQIPTDRPAKQWMYFPALALLGFVVIRQRKRLALLS